MKSTVKRLLAVLLAAAVVWLSAAPGLAAAPEGRTLRVAFPEAEGYSMTAADGSRSGLVVDFLNEIAKYTGWQYEYVPMLGSEALESLGRGEVDLLGGQYYMEELTEYYGYPDYSCGAGKLILLARQDDESIRPFDLNSFNGKTIGVYERAYESIRRLEIYLELNGLDCTLKYYNYEQLEETDSLEPYLERGEVDLILESSLSQDCRFYAAASFDSQPQYIVTQAGDRETLEELNRALEMIYASNPSFATEVYEKNFPYTEETRVLLSQGEREYVARTGTVTVAVPRDWHPLYCLESSDSHDGVAAEVLTRIAAYSGLGFDWRCYDSYAEALAAVERGEADLLAFYLGEEADAAGHGLALSAPYIELSSILVRNKEVSYPAEGLTGAVLEGREMPSFVTAENIVTYDNVTDALSDVNRGKIDFFFGISAQLERIIQGNNFNNLVQQGNLVNDEQAICFAVPIPAQRELFSILNKGIHSISEEEMTAISSANLVSIGERNTTLSGLIYANPRVAIILVTLFLTLLLLMVIVSSRAKIRAAAMRSELTQAEADSRAKSDFLSRMSHEIRTPMNAIVGLADLVELQEGVPEKTRNDLHKIKSSSKYLLNLINDILDMSRVESGRMELATEPFSLGGLLGDLKSMLAQQAANRGVTFSLESEVTDDVVVGDAIRLRQVLINLLSNAFKFTQPGGRVRAVIRQEGASDTAATFTFLVEDNGMGIPKADQERIFESFVQLGSNYAKTQGTGLGLPISRSIVGLMGGQLQVESEPEKGSRFFFTVALPKGTLPQRQETTPIPELLQGAVILLAEDNDLNAEIATELLRSQGALVCRAENGAEAVAQFQASPPGQFSCVLMDIMMPEMNGLDATAAIRALPRADAITIPILAMTANAFQEDKDSALAAGMSGFIPKPIDVGLLFRELQRVLSNQPH